MYVNCFIVRLACLESPIHLIQTSAVKNGPAGIAQWVYAAPDSRRWFALVVVLAAAFMAVMDFFIVNVSVPAIQAQLHASYAEIQFVIAGYGLAYAVGLITGGRLGDIYGRKRIFIIGLAAFTLTSGLCGTAPTAHALIAARVAQGLAAAAMFPQVLSIIRVAFPSHEQSKAFGFFGTTLGAASAAGPLLGGILIRFDPFGLSWRPVFLVNLPIGLCALFAAHVLLEESRASRPLRLDLGGMAMVTAGLALLIYPLIFGRASGWPLWAWASMLFSVPAFLAFILYEIRKSRLDGSALVELSLFKHIEFSSGLLFTSVFSTGISAFFFMLTLFLQTGLGLSPLEAGLMFAPFAFGFMSAAALSPKLTLLLGKRVLQTGVAAMIMGILLLLVIVPNIANEGAAYLIPALFIYGSGQGLVMASLYAIILPAIPAEHIGSASGILTTVQQTSFALGVAVIGGWYLNKVGAHGTRMDFFSAFPLALRVNIGVLVVAFAVAAIRKGVNCNDKDNKDIKDEDLSASAVRSCD